MKSIVLLSIFLGACYALPPRAIRGDCPEFCPQIYNPVCGSDGKEFRSFSNNCQMTVFNCMKSRDFHPLRAGLCDEDETLRATDHSAPSQEKKMEVQRKVSLPRAPRGNCPQFCPTILSPICASDGQESRTFSNKCELNAFNCWESRNFLALRAGPCDNDGTFGIGGLAPSQEKKMEVQGKRCKPCTRIYLPVCGFDGKEQRVFGNHCEMNFFNCMESRNFALLKDEEC